MGRKQKKGRGTSAQSQQQQQQQQQHTETQPRSSSSSLSLQKNKHKRDIDDDGDDDLVDSYMYVSLIITRPTSKNNHNNNNNNSSTLQASKSKPRVILSAHDANRLDILSQENVLLLSLSARLKDHDSDSVAAVALLPVEIQSSTVAASGGARPIAPGTVHITSSFLTDRLVRRRLQCESEDDPGRTGTPATSNATATTTMAVVDSPLRDRSTATVTTPTTVSSQSSSKKASFSFRLGGGGDAMYNLYSTPSPSPRSTPSTAVAATATKPSKQKVVILPVRSILGQRLVESLCAECYKLILEPVVEVPAVSTIAPPTTAPTTTPSILDTILNNHIDDKSQLLLLRRLVLAHTIRRHVQPNEILKISVAGRYTHWRVVNCQAKPTPASSPTSSPTDNNNKVVTEPHDADTAALNHALQHLCLDDGEHNKLGKHIESIITKKSSSKPLLFQIVYETIIEFVATSSNSALPPILAPQQTESQPSTPEPHVVGLDATLVECRTLLTTPLQQPELFAKTKPPRGILLHGPSGVGKTGLARQLGDEIGLLKDTKGNGITVEYVHCASLLSQTAVVGQAERQLTRLFRTNSSINNINNYNNNTAKLLILDDLHLIGAKRGGLTAGADRLTATLLALLDGIEVPSQQQQQQQRQAPIVMILGVTRNPAQLDAALRRPGRLDVEVQVPLPDDTETRAQILQFHSRNTVACIAADGASGITQSDWLELGTLAKGFNGADCLLAVKEAVRMSLLANDNGSISTTIEQQQQQPPLLQPVSLVHLRAAIRATKPSAIKSITVEIPRVLWSSIGGMDAVKQELREAIELPVTHRDFFDQMRVAPPRGILLYGPPGCSKTLMARALATEGQMNFLAVKGPELLSKWLGESERALASLFRRARMASPCIIFFDEIDAIASKRGGPGDSASSGRLLSQLLTELDGVSSSTSFTKHHRVVVVGATNRPDLLDTALTRPGRIDRKIYVGVPDEVSRSRILELNLQGRACDGDINVPQLARDSEGCSGAEMVAICRDAALLALEESDGLSMASSHEMPTIAMRHLVQALNDMQRQITPEMIEFYASYKDSTRAAVG